MSPVYSPTVGTKSVKKKRHAQTVSKQEYSPSEDEYSPTRKDYTPTKEEYTPSADVSPSPYSSQKKRPKYEPQDEYSPSDAGDYTPSVDDYSPASRREQYSPSLTNGTHRSSRMKSDLMGAKREHGRQLHRRAATSPSYTQTLSRTNHLKKSTENGNSRPTMSSPFSTGRNKSREGSMFEQIASPTEDGGSPYMMPTDGGQTGYSPSAYSPFTAYSPLPFKTNSRGAYTPNSNAGYTPETVGQITPTPYSPFSSPHTGDSPDARLLLKKKRMAERAAKREKLEQARAKKKREAKQRAESRDKVSSLFIDVEDVITDFMWDQKFKNHAFTYSCRPKFALQKMETTQMIGAKVSTSLKNHAEMIHQDFWANTSMLDPLIGKECGVIRIDENDPILDASTVQPDKHPEQIEKEVAIAMREKEALFLRRGMLITNNLQTDGLKFRHGVEGAEKMLVREPPEDLDKMTFVERVERTFKDVQKPPVHPTKPNMKVKRVMPFVPNRDLWAHPYIQVKYDESPVLPALQKVPPVLYKATPSPLLTAFAIFQFNDDSQAHELDRSYAWDNQGECAMAAEEESEFALVEWPAQPRPDEEVTKQNVMFSSIQHEYRLRKLTALIPFQRRTFEGQLFGAKSLSVAWRNPTDEENERDKTVAEAMFE